MKCPAFRYIHLLLLEKQTPRQIGVWLFKIQHGSAGLSTVYRAHQGYNFPQSKYDPLAQEWIMAVRQIGINFPLHDNLHAQIAHDMAKTPDIAWDINILMTIGVPFDQIPELIKDKHKIRLAPKTLQCYAIMFWDFRYMVKEDWRIFGEGLPPERRATLYYALTHSEEETRVRINVRTEVDTSKLLSEIAGTCYSRFKELSRYKNEDNDKEARNWARLGILTCKEQDKIRVRGVSKLQDALQLKLTVDKPDIQDVGELESVGLPVKNSGDTKEER